MAGSKTTENQTKRGRPRKSAAGGATGSNSTQTDNPPAARRKTTTTQNAEEEEPGVEETFRAHRDSERNPVLERQNLNLLGKQQVLAIELEEAKKREAEANKKALEQVECIKRMQEELERLKSSQSQNSESGPIRRVDLSKADPPIMDDDEDACLPESEDTSTREKRLALFNKGVSKANPPTSAARTPAAGESITVVTPGKSSVTPHKMSASQPKRRVMITPSTHGLGARAVLHTPEAPTPLGPRAILHSTDGATPHTDTPRQSQSKPQQQGKTLASPWRTPQNQVSGTPIPVERGQNTAASTKESRTPVPPTPLPQPPSTPSVDQLEREMRERVEKEMREHMEKEMARLRARFGLAGENSTPQQPNTATPQQPNTPSQQNGSGNGEEENDDSTPTPRPTTEANPSSPSTPRPLTQATRQVRPDDELAVPDELKGLVNQDKTELPYDIQTPPRDFLQVVLKNPKGKTKAKYRELEAPRTSPGPEDDDEDFKRKDYVPMTPQQDDVWRQYPVRKMVWLYSFSWAPLCDPAELPTVFMKTWNFYAFREKGSHVADYNQAITYKLKREQGSYRSAWMRSMMKCLPKLLHFRRWNASFWLEGDRFLTHPRFKSEPVTIKTKFTNPFLGSVLYATLWAGKHAARRYCDGNHEQFCEWFLRGQLICFAYTMMKQSLKKLENVNSGFRDDFDVCREIFLKLWNDWKRLEKKPAPASCAVINGRPVGSSAEAIRLMVVTQFKEAIARGKRQREKARRKRPSEEQESSASKRIRMSDTNEEDIQDDNFEIDGHLVVSESNRARLHIQQLVQETKILRHRNDLDGLDNNGWPSSEAPGLDDDESDSGVDIDFDSDGDVEGSNFGASQESELTSGAMGFNEEDDQIGDGTGLEAEVGDDYL
ncbi:hypothetical protein BJ508DRAFT_311334 [Ascobolus immersus RN42]|uniref:Uncharacterized protein n=1 Tax=Ascobolus immersus RN42 TaxID=1160509 RepID=A0A3N4HS37_ASCIM|nr:hypothetical protein BJ508DRAFT_311334 [Ascobolus immersus RN42]